MDTLSSSPSNQKPKPQKPGYLLGGFLIAVLAALLIASLVVEPGFGPPKPGPRTILLGLYVMAWGFMFLASYFFSHKTFFFRGLIWLCESYSQPRGRKMAFFYFGLAFFLGGIAILIGLGIFVI